MRILERLGLTTMGQLEAALDNVSSEYQRIIQKIEVRHATEIQKAKEETDNKWIKALSDLEDYHLNLTPENGKINVSFRLNVGTRSFRKFILRSNIPDWRTSEDNGQVVLHTVIETAELPNLKKKIDETLQYIQRLEQRFLEAELMREVLRDN